MNWRIGSACNVTRLSLDGDEIWRIQLQAAALSRVTVGLCLLWHGLISQLDLLDANGKLGIRLTWHVDRDSERAAFNLVREAPELALPAVELEHWMHYFLRTLRDGAAQVDHLDLEAVAAKTAVVATFVIKFPDVKPGMDPEEMRRHLGL